MTRLRLDMYPLPGPPSTPPTWEDVERLALHYPAAHDAVTMVQRGDWTREQALVALVYALADSFSRLFKREIDARALEVLDTMVKEPCGCTVSTYVRRRVTRFPCESHRSDDAVDPVLSARGTDA